MSQADKDLVQPPVINNIKIRFSVASIALPKLKKGIKKISDVKDKKTFKKLHNFIVFKSEYVFIIFFNCGTVNITGIKCLTDISQAVYIFCQTFDISRGNLAGSIIIDNITASGSFNREVNLRTLKEKINDSENKSRINSASFNPNYFPAAFCKTFGIGTILIFGGGKYNIVGAKSQQDVTDVFNLAKELLHTIEKK
jgi:TATA-box binding protein (TBP) (component of TFIID and TFIIIB)